jgi:hypothetical protein
VREVCEGEKEMKCKHYIDKRLGHPHYCDCWGDIPDQWRDVRKAMNAVKKFVNKTHAINCALTYDIIEFIDDYISRLPAPPSGKEE